MEKEFKKIEEITLESLSYIKPKMNVEIKIFMSQNDWIDQILFEVEFLDDVIEEVKDIVEEENIKPLSIFINTITYEELLEIELKQLEYNAISKYVEDNKKDISVREYMKFVKDFRQNSKIKYEVYSYFNKKNKRSPQPIDFNKIN